MGRRHGPGGFSQVRLKISPHGAQVVLILAVRRPAGFALEGLRLAVRTDRDLFNGYADVHYISICTG